MNMMVKQEIKYCECGGNLTSVNVIDMEKQKETGIKPCWKNHTYCVICKKSFD